MGRVIDALLQRDARAAASATAARVAAAGRVALAPTGPMRALPPPGVGGDQLVPVTPWDVGLPGVWDRAAAMSLPTISRARDLICAVVGALPITAWTVDYAQTPAAATETPPPGWAQRPDPNRTRQWLLAWTTDDLYFYGAAHWLIVDRYETTYPRRFERIIPGDLTLDETTGRTLLRGAQIDPGDVVEFLSPIEGLLSNGWRAISIALQLDDAAERFASAEVPAGVIQQTGGEDMSGDELALESRRFTDARHHNVTAALNQYLEYRPINYDPSQMQLVEGRTYQALELARLGNAPPYLVGAPAGTGMTYLNAEQAKADLIDFGALPYIGCIEQTLSGPNVVPRGQAIRLDLNAWLRNPFTTTTAPAPSAERSPNDVQEAVSP